MIGLGLGLVRQAVRNASGQAWTPAQLFAAGEQGVWYEPKPEYLYQDAAGTIPVTADGDPVGRADDLAPNAGDATQDISTQRPVYNTDSAIKSLFFDDVDDYLDLPEIFGDEDNFVFAIAVRPQDGGSGRYARYFSMVRTGLNLQCGYDREDKQIFTRVANQSQTANYSITLGEKIIVQHIRQGGVNTIRINGQSYDFNSSSAPSADSDMGPSLGAGYQPSTFKLKGNIYGAIYRHGTYTEEDAINVDTYLASRAGITL